MISPRPKQQNDNAASKFIAGVGEKTKLELIDIHLRVDRALLERIDARAVQLGMKRTSFFISAALEKLGER